MKGLRKIALATAVSAVSTGAVAELQLLDDAGMQDVTGQAGLTIDVESQWEIGEFAYEDAGFLLIQGIRMGGNSLGNGTGTGGTMMDNLRLEVDVAGPGETLAYGFSNMREIAQIYVDKGNTDPTFGDVASGLDSKRGLAIDEEKTYGDGDLVIHFDFTDGWHSEGGLDQYEADGRFAGPNQDDYDTAEAVLEHAVDFRLEIDAIGLASSTYTVGSAGLDTQAHDGVDSAAAGTTTLISQLGIQGYLGPEDLHIENNGNGFGAVDTNGDGILSDAEIAATSTGIGNANSKITWGSYFKITDLDVYIDIAGVQISDMKIHNERGDLSGLDGTSSFNFAHSIREIYAVKDSVINYDKLDGVLTGTEQIDGRVDAIALNTEFKGDIDIGHLSFGDTGDSIGKIYITDMYSKTNWTISAH